MALETEYHVLRTTLLNAPKPPLGQPSLEWAIVYMHWYYTTRADAVGKEERG